MRTSLVLPVSCLALLAACAEQDVEDVVDLRIFGPTTTTVDTTSGGFEAAVGRLILRDSSNNVLGTCSATAVTRSSIVTARHCLCGAVSTPNTMFCLPQGGSGDFCASLDGNEGFTSAVTSFDSHPSWADTCNWIIPPNILDDTSAKGTDVAIGFLASNIPVGVLPSLPKVHLGNDPLAFGLTESAANGGSPVYFQVGFGDTNWGQDPANNQAGIRRRGEAGSDLHMQSAPPFTTMETWFLESDANDDPGVANASTSSGGDSGGALFMQPMAGGSRVGSPYLIGVISGGSAVAWDDDQQWAITGSRNQHRDGYGNVKNSDLVAQALAPDVDQDGVLDNNDNCPPAACPLNINTCANPTQSDTDGDQLGNACDLCDTVKDAPSFGVLGPDGDDDWVGDVCDVCPEQADSQYDGDSDGVGDACDTCTDDDNGYASCLSNAGCSGGVCLKESGSATGHCSEQNDDADGDGLGSVCDGCPTNPANGTNEIFANSNIDMEGIEGVNALGDVCEPVPQYVARPVLTRFEDRNDNCPVGATPETCENVAKLFSSATIGHSTGSSTAQHDAGVGFRHCDCYDAAEHLLDRETCLSTQCAVLPADYASPASTYHRISIGVNGVGTPAYPAALTDRSLTRHFTSTPSHSDVYPHPDDQIEGAMEDEEWRVGPTEMLLWPWKSDVLAGYVPAHPVAYAIDERTTGGILWTLSSFSKTTTGQRDAAASKRLRSVYTYVVTPLVIPWKPSGSLKWEPALRCGTPDCYAFLRPGLERVNPTYLDFLDHERAASVVHEQAGTLVVSNDKNPGVYAAGDLVSGTIKNELLAGTSMWLSPVESEHATRMLGAIGHGAYMPAVWTRSSHVNTLEFTEGRLVEKAVANHGLLMPSERSEFTALYSASERAVFVLGGLDEWGANTQDVWRFDVTSGTWAPIILDGVGLQRVVDATYVPGEQRFIVVDRVDDPQENLVRILLVDPIGGRTHELASYKDTGIHEDIAVGADGLGDFVLLLGDADANTVEGFRFAVDEGDLDASLAWIGEGVFDGVMIGGPQLTDDGPIVPMDAGDTFRFTMIGVEDLAAATEGPTGF